MVYTLDIIIYRRLYMNKLYNITEASKILGVSRATIYKWKKANKIYFININGINKISTKELERLRGEF